MACGNGVFGVFAARKLKITTLARLWAGVGLRSLKKALERGGLRVACGSGVFGDFAARKLKITTPAWFRAPKPEKGPGKGRLAGGVREWCFRSFRGRAPKPEKGPGKGRLVGGVREWCFRSFRGQKAQNHHSRASLGWYRAPKPKQGPGEACGGVRGVREWCFRSFRGQKAQNHHSRAFLGWCRALKPEKKPWKGEACGWRAGVVFWEFSRPESLKSPLPRVSGLKKALERGGLWVACGSGVFGVLAARKLKITTPARLWAGVGLQA